MTTIVEINQIGHLRKPFAVSNSNGKLHQLNIGPKFDDPGAITSNAGKFPIMKARNNAQVSKSFRSFHRELNIAKNNGLNKNRLPPTA